MTFSLGDTIFRDRTFYLFWGLAAKMGDDIIICPSNMASTFSHNGLERSILQYSITVQQKVKMNDMFKMVKRHKIHDGSTTAERIQNEKK